MIAARFIGGPWEGRMQAMQKAMPEFLVRACIPTPVRWSVKDDDPVTAPNTPTIRHVYRTIGTAHDGATLMLYWGKE